MQNKIYIKNDNLVIEVPLTKHRSNPYDENYHPKMPNIVGLILHYKNKGYDDIGFAFRIDREYAGKNDDAGDFIVKWHEDKKDFIKKCKELKIDYIEYAI